MNTLSNRVRTDLNSVGEIKRFYDIGQSISADQIASIGLADPPASLVTTGYIGSQSVVLPVEGLYQYDAIKKYIRNNMRDGFLLSENARVAILNGTTVNGLAAGRRAELESFGYNLVQVANAPSQEYVETMLIDMSEGSSMQYTRTYLEKRLGVIARTTVPVGVAEMTDADFVIILGTDEAAQ